jgi:hypothetical protein
MPIQKESIKNDNFEKTQLNLVVIEVIMFKVGLVLVAFYLTLTSEMTLIFYNSLIGFQNTDIQHKYQM